MLVSVFAKEFRNNEKFGHLRNFFIIIPPLCINYVEYLIASRLRLTKRIQNDDELTFVDDGFSLGIAYVLTLLNQVYFFSSLNWFKSMEVSIKSSQESVMEEQRIAQRSKDESFAQTLAIRLKRLQDYQTEFTYLSHTLQAAIMVFKTKETKTIESKEESFLEDF
jgi:WASH complex subunit 7